MVRREKTNYVIQSVAHALDVLEQFTGETEELGVTDLSKRLKLHKNNVFRLLATLEARGYIEQNKSTDNYRLGIRCLQIGQTYVGQMGLLRQAKPIMEEVVQSCRETVYLSLLRRGAVVALQSVDSDQPVRTVSLLGQSLPLHCTAAGKVHLAFESEEEIKNALPEGLERHTEKTITRRSDLIADLRGVAERGYAIESGEYMPDLRSIAVPIRDYTRSVVGSLAITGPAYRLPEERIDKEVAPLALRAGRDLSSRLGYNA
jgi:IclR family transcriptional regulator, KDG regulon repressor